MTSYGLPLDPGKYCIVVNYVVFEANKIKFKPNQYFSCTVTFELNAYLMGLFLGFGPRN